MNTHSTKRPYTLRELGDAAAARNMTASAYFEQLLNELGPWPTPPAGYRLDPKSEDRWTGPETVQRGWIITPTWYARTDTHYVELWAAEHYSPNYSRLTKAEALQLAAVLTAAADGK